MTEPRTPPTPDSGVREEAQAVSDSMATAAGRLRMEVRMDDNAEHLRRAINGYRESRKQFAAALGFGPDASDDQLLEAITELRRDANG